MKYRLSQLLYLFASSAIFTLRVIIMAVWGLIGLGWLVALYFILVGGPAHPNERDVFNGLLWAMAAFSSCVVFVRTETRYQQARGRRNFRSEMTLGLAPAGISLLWIPFHYL